MPRHTSQTLMTGEQIVYLGQLHWITYTSSIFMTVLGWVMVYIRPGDVIQRNVNIVLPEQIHEILNYGVFGLVVLGVFMMLMAYLNVHHTEMCITNRRVLIKFGIFSRNTFELLLSKVEGVNVEQGMLGRILGYGTVLVQGTGSGVTPLFNLIQPEHFQRSLLEQIRLRNESLYRQAHHRHD